MDREEAASIDFLHPKAPRFANRDQNKQERKVSFTYAFEYSYFLFHDRSLSKVSLPDLRKTASLKSLGCFMV